MGGHLEPLPLFPLHTVLFPYAPLQLHVFESRYRELIQYCSEEDTGFGIVLIRQGAEVGGEAEPYMVGGRTLYGGHGCPHCGCPHKR